MSENMMMSDVRPVSLDDAEAICRIYNHYVVTTAISFEESEVGTAEMSDRITEVTQSFPWLILERDGAMLGYAYATKWRVRSAYRFSAEVSVYLSPEARGQGAGTILYGALLSQLAKQGVHTAIGGIALPNEASVHLHKKCGFKQVAQFAQVGFKHGRWIDVAYWQKQL